MQRLSEAAILEHIEAGDCFECEIEDGSFSLKIEDYAPTVGAAIHAGHQFRKSLHPYCALTEDERLYEEDPFTNQLVEVLPITIIGQDSRYQYDLNRPLATCIYQQAWGRQVWHTPLSQREKRQSKQRHQAFYRVWDALLTALERRFGACLVYDIHSYNQRERGDELPTFNLGTAQIDRDRWSEVLDHLLNKLSSIRLGDSTARAACDEVFRGLGYLIAHTNGRFENTLVLPLEINKVFMDENSGTLYPLVLNELQSGLKQVMVDTAILFSRHHVRHKRAARLHMLPSRIDPALLQLDRKLFQLAKGLETLRYINPTNIAQERKAFLSRHGAKEPAFRYRPLDIDPYRFREQLYRLPVEMIRDPSIAQLYREVVDSLCSKIDLLISAGQEKFVYNSLKYYGEPSLEDERNADFLLHAPLFESTESRSVTSVELAQRFRERAQEWGMQCKVEISNRLAAAAMVSNARRTVYLGKGLSFTETEAQQLLHHELGVHMATTLNARTHKLKVFALGLPGNTMTQEGLAILNEFHSATLSLGRLKELALRVLAVREMLRHGSFRHTWQYLLETHGLDQNEAFRLALRVHRGGGFTKDHLYLRGVAKALELASERNISGLYIGKTGFDYLPVIDEMIARELIRPPMFIPQHLTQPEPAPEILSYLVHSIQRDREKRYFAKSAA